MKQIEMIQRLAITIAACSLACPAVAFAPASDTAAIVNSGSTNQPGFRIVVERSGNAEYTAAPRRPSPPLLKQPDGASPGRRAVPGDLVRRFYADLEAAQPLATLPKPRCAKSASFGFRLTIEFGSVETPDLSCGDGDNAKLRALIRDANEISALFSAR